MVAVNTERVYSYLDSDNYSFLLNLKDELKKSGYTVSLSKIIRLAVIELRKNNSKTDIENKLRVDINE